MAREDRDGQPGTRASDIYAGSAITRAVDRVKSSFADNANQRPNMRMIAPSRINKSARPKREEFTPSRDLVEANQLPQGFSVVPRGGASLIDRIQSNAGAFFANVSQPQGSSTPPREGSSLGDRIKSNFNAFVANVSQPQREGKPAPERPVTPASAINGITVESGPKRGSEYNIPANDPNGVAMANRVNTFDNRSALNEFAAANAQRQQAIDSRSGVPGGRIAYIGGAAPGSMEDRQAQANELLSRLDGRQSVAEEQGIRAQADALLGQADTAAGLEQVRMSEAGDTDRALLEAESSLAYNDALTQSATARAAGGAQAGGIDPSGFKALVDSGALRLNPETRQIDLTDPNTAAVYQELLRGIAPGGFEQPVGLADGGVVPQPQSAMAMPALGRGGPAMPASQDIMAYQQMTNGMRQMGLAPVDFESFMSMRQQSAPGAGAPPAPPQMAGQPASAMGFADGGMVPDVSGKMVVDSNPQSAVDSIPAMIDGETPAALDSGEFVLPRDVVMFFGTDKLNKMIASARSKDTNGPESSAVGGSALQAALAGAGAGPAAPTNGPV